MMTSRFIYLPQLSPTFAEIPAEQITCLSLTAPSAQWVSCTLAELLPAEMPDEVYLFLPNLHVLSTQVSVPKKQQKHLTQILPFLCEEKFAGDIDEIHLAAGGIDGETVSVRAIQKTLLEAVLYKFHQQGIHPRGVFSDAEPRLYAEETVLLLSPTACLLTAQQRAITLHPSQLTRLAALLQQQPSPAQITVYRHPDMDLDFDSSLINLQLEELRSQGFAINEHEFDSDQPLLSECTAQGIELTPSQYVNLLTGPYAPARQHTRKNWQPVAWAAAVLIGLNVLYLLASGVYFEQRAQQFQQASEQLYRQYFPQDRRIVNIRTQTQGHLERGRQGSGDGFLHALGQLQPGWEQHQHNLKLKSLRYHSQRRELLLDVESKSISQLDQLQQTLGPQAELLSANEDNHNGARGRIKFQEGVK